ncbi:MAG: hypothetical protein ACJATL_000795, partial [Rickettsiales bacterium]
EGGLMNFNTQKRLQKSVQNDTIESIQSFLRKIY